MTRNRKSAKSAGARFERQVADYLARALMDDGIDRQVKTGSKDSGDIRGVKFHGDRVAVECKDCARMELGRWLGEAEVEAGNIDSPYPVVVHKRRGVGDPGGQYVTMTLRTLAAFIIGGAQFLENDE